MLCVLYFISGLCLVMGQSVNPEQYYAKLSPTDEQRLYDKLHYRGFSKVHRPIRNSTDTVHIKFGVALINIYELDEHKEQLSTSVWLRKLWRDYRLQWEPGDFAGLTALRIPADDIWRPDIVLYNSMSKEVATPLDVLAVVYSSGDVLWIPPMRLESFCPLDLSKFPFDTQTCQLKFGSWTYDGNKIMLDFYEGQGLLDLSDYDGSSEWEVLSAPGKLTNKYYPCCSEPYPDITYNITMQRRVSYYHYVFVTPAVMLALMTPVLFLLPPDDTGKFPLGGALLVCLAVLLHMLQAELPFSRSSVPAIGVYYAVTFVFVSLSILLSAFTNNIANRATRLSRPPDLLKTIVLGCLGKLLCVPYDPDYGVGSSDVALQNSEDEKRGMRSSGGSGEWRLMAMVLDRIFFILFLIVVIITTIALLA